MRAIFMVLSVAALTALAGCSKEQNKSNTTGAQTAPATTGTAPAPGTAAPERGGPTAAAAIPEEARKVYSDRCAACHGADGDGNGAASAALNPKPRNYHDEAWQKSVSDDYLRDIIVKGGAGVGKSPLMPPNPDLADKPEVVNGLVALIRSFGKQ